MPYTFIRNARKGDDPEVIKSGGMLWEWTDEDLASNEDVWLKPEHVQQHGLTDSLREAYATRPQALWDQDLREATTAPEDPPTRPRSALTGAHNDQYRWEFVEDGTDLWIVIDNRPAIEAAKAADKPPPFLEQTRLPWDVLNVIHSQVRA